MGKMLPDDFLTLQRGDQKNMCVFSGGQFIYPVGVILSISRRGGGSSFGGLFEMQQCLERDVEGA